MSSEQQPIDQLIEGLTILKKYLRTDAYPTHCEHDVLMVMVPDDTDIPTEEVARLEELGFHQDDERGLWASFRFGSA